MFFLNLPSLNLSQNPLFRKRPRSLRFGFQVDSHAFASMLCILVSEGEINDAFEVYDDMLAAGYLDVFFIWYFLYELYPWDSSPPRPPFGRCFLGRFFKASNMQIWGYEADASCFKALLCGSLQHGDLDTAARLISDAQDRSRSLSRESLELFFLQAARRGRGELAKPILEEAQRAGVLISERIVNSVHRACWHSTSQELASVFWLPTCPSGCCTVVLTFWFFNFSSHPHCFAKCPVSLSFILPAAGTISPWSCQKKKNRGGRWSLAG